MTLFETDHFISSTFYKRREYRGFFLPTLWDINYVEDFRYLNSSVDENYDSPSVESGNITERKEGSEVKNGKRSELERYQCKELF